MLNVQTRQETKYETEMLFDEEAGLCQCCRKNPVAGYCRVNGANRVLTKTCRRCFMRFGGVAELKGVYNKSFPSIKSGKS